MKFDVKNTTIKWILDMICPHSCRGCGRLGAIICECCKNDIFLAMTRICPLCRCELDEKSKKCLDCETELEEIYTVGWREKVLARMIKDFKYRGVRECGEELAELLCKVIPDDGVERVIVPLPTIGRHVRERGIDHTLFLARRLAKMRGWRCEQVLERRMDFVQVGTKAAEREAQADKSYQVRKKIEKDKNYLLLDDVWTTGATIRAAERVMRGAGAQRVGAVVLAVGRAKKSPDEPEMED